MKKMKKKQEVSHYLIRVEDVPRYLNNVITHDQWKRIVMSHSGGIYRMTDQMMLEPLGARLTVFMLKELDRTESLLLVSWSVLRQIAPYANGAARKRSPAETHKLCYEDVRYFLEAALVSNVIYRMITPDVLREVTYMGFLVQKTIVTTVGSSSWFPAASGKVARKKAEAMKLTIAFPFNLTSLAALEQFYAEMPDVAVAGSSFLLSWLNASRFLRRVQMRHQDQILFPLGSVNAMHSYTTNIVNMAGGLLQPVLYYHGASAGFNYGGIGQIIGHEMMHAFDVAGRSVDETGASSDWWPQQATVKYVEQTGCLRTMHREALRKRALILDPRLDSEDLADVMGTRAAFDAFSNLTGQAGASRHGIVNTRKVTNTPANFAGFTDHQLFFIGHCAKMCDPNAPPRERDPTLAYSPNWARCVVPLMNMPEFADAFHCPVGTFMNPELKCRFW
ncbi:neprilysin-1-like [Amblyomma americanum]